VQGFLLLLKFGVNKHCEFSPCGKFKCLKLRQSDLVLVCIFIFRKCDAHIQELLLELENFRVELLQLLKLVEHVSQVTPRLLLLLLRVELRACDNLA